MASNSKIYINLLAASALLAAILFYFYNPEVDFFFPKCPFLTFTGFFCPGCGSQRALHQLLHGNVLQAANFNVLLVLSIPFLAFHQFVNASNYFGWFRKKISSPFYSPQFAYVLLVFVLVYWILRNIPHEPFILLAPH